MLFCFTIGCFAPAGVALCIQKLNHLLSEDFPKKLTPVTKNSPQIDSSSETQDDYLLSEKTPARELHQLLIQTTKREYEQDFTKKLTPDVKNNSPQTNSPSETQDDYLLSEKTQGNSYFHFAFSLNLIFYSTHNNPGRFRRKFCQKTFFTKRKNKFF